MRGRRGRPSPPVAAQRAPGPVRRARGAECVMSRHKRLESTGNRMRGASERWLQDRGDRNRLPLDDGALHGFDHGDYGQAVVGGDGWFTAVEHAVDQVTHGAPPGPGELEA